ncbi:MAG: hypothetical protein ACKVI4_18150, partial [Actinomycetales bacterium]
LVALSAPAPAFQAGGSAAGSIASAAPAVSRLSAVVLHRLGPFDSVRVGEASSPGPVAAASPFAFGLGPVVEPVAASAVIGESSDAAPVVILAVGVAGGPMSRVAALRPPLSLFSCFHGLGGFDVAATQVGGYHMVGGADSSVVARRLFEQRTWAVSSEDARAVDWRAVGAGVDVVVASPRSLGFDADQPEAKLSAAMSSYMLSVRAVLESNALVGVIESGFSVSYADDTKFFKEVASAAAAGGYTLSHRQVHPDRLGSALRRPRLFLLLIRSDVYARMGEPPLLSERMTAASVASVLQPAAQRQFVDVGDVRWLREPQRVGTSIRLGYYGRGGAHGAVWCATGTAPPALDHAPSRYPAGVFLHEGALITPTPRESAILQGLPLSMDIGEARGERAVRRLVAQTVSVHSARAVLAVVKPYAQGFKALPALPPAPASASPTPSRPTVRLHASGSPQWCLDGGCTVCNTCNAFPRRAEVWRLFTSRCFVWLLGREAVLCSAEEQAAHRSVVRDSLASWHGFSYRL